MDFTRCRATHSPVTCPPVEQSAAPACCRPFSVCVGNYTLTYDGTCCALAPRRNRIPDGVYSAIQFQDGCVVGVGQLPVPSYTPAPCCNDGSDGSGSTPAPVVPVSPDACNLTQMGPAGLQTLLNVAPGNGVSVQGCGTTGNPLRISVSASQGAAISAVSGDPPIRVQGDGSSSAPLIIGMNPSVAPGNYGGLMVNQFGLVTGYQADGGSPTVRAIVGTAGVNAQEQAPAGGGVYSVGLADTGVNAATWRLGRYDVAVNTRGQLTNVSQAVAPLTAGSFYSPPDPSVPGDTGKRISYNADGIITGVQAV
ncbi:hypothetical protein P3T23_004522 [Paraburkholderia sp. GAS448]|uniref:hypothetical protein n=1 Tax=Paraburkholderia sp. GAS448 TaxID=3035136 RepID=UPI003D218EC5